MARPIVLAGALLASLAHAAEPPLRLEFRSWDPGFLPGDWGRTTVTLTELDGGAVRLELATARPASPDQRGRFNATGFIDDPSLARVLEGRLQRRPGGAFTARLTASGDGAAGALVCAPATEAVHAAGATVTEPSCNPCSRRCTEAPRWSPPHTSRRAGFSCRWRADEPVNSPGTARKAGSRVPPPLPGLRRVPERLFFVAAPPAVEHVTGDTDCPPEGLREAGAPQVDWSAFPEGVTALRDVRGSLLKEAKVRPRVFLVRRQGTQVTVELDGTSLSAPDLQSPARSEAAQRTFGLACWKARERVHAEAVTFSLPAGEECDGREERVSSRAPRALDALHCRVLDGEHVSEDTLLFAPGRLIERLDVDADCTVRRAVRLLSRLDAPMLLELQ